MAIAQSRVISLIYAGMDYKQGLETQMRHIHTHYNYVKNGTMSAEAALEYLYSIANPDFLLQQPSQSPSIISIEHQHFFRNAKRNERRALIATHKRRAEGKRTRLTYQPNAPIPLSNSPPQLPQQPATDIPALTPAQEIALQMEIAAMELEEQDKKPLNMDGSLLDLARSYPVPKD